MVIGLEWLVTEQFFIACRWDLRDEILRLEPWDILPDSPKFYFAGGPLKVPSHPSRGFIEVSITSETEVGIDLRMLNSYRDWEYSVDGSEPQPIPVEDDILYVGIEPGQVGFFLRKNKKAHTTFKFFVEEPPETE
ncbi:MAG: hypothetical protein OEX81_04450 [Candidatus Pacebacteria bacterium]|nr:hypothetical protein [Candidatus Paceibacterota bacterium]